MTSILNKLAAALSALGLGALAADITGMADVPDSAGAQVVYVLAILGGLAWRTLPDQDDTPGPDALQPGGKLDFRQWLKNIFGFLSPPSPASTGAIALTGILLASACGGVQTTTPYDKCLLVERVFGYTSGSAAAICLMADLPADKCATAQRGVALARETTGGVCTFLDKEPRA